MAKYSRFPRRGEQWTLRDRKLLEREWNANVTRGRNTRLSMRQFATERGIEPSTLSRELSKGTAGKPFFNKIKHEWFYPEYSAEKAHFETRQRATNKGRKLSASPLTNRFSERLVEFLQAGFSVATCLHRLRAEGWSRLPAQRTVYYALKTGAIQLPDGTLRYRPRKARPPRPPIAKALVLPDRRSIEERPPAIAERQTFGHWEMDCVLSCRSGKGGLLVLVERKTRYCLIRRLQHISQSAVSYHLRKLMKDNALHTVLSVTTDNGCEFLHQAKLDAIFHAPVYYTHAYASWEKGTVENTNRLIRTWCPKSTTDFSRLPPSELTRLQTNINAISRPITLHGATAHEAFQSTTTH